MSRPKPLLVSVPITSSVHVTLKQYLLDIFPDAPAFIRDTMSDRRVTLATVTRYARRIANAIKNGHLENPALCSYVTEATAVRAYWDWVAHHYERRVDKCAMVCVPRGHSEVKTQATTLTVGALARPWEGKQIALVRPGYPGTHLRSTRAWTLHIPPSNRQVPPHSHEDPQNICHVCIPFELDDDELRAIAEAFYDAWGIDRSPFDLPRDAPLFGRPPLSGPYAVEPKPMPLGHLNALLPSHSTLEGLLMRLGVDVSPHAHVFGERLQVPERPVPDTVVIDRRALADYANPQEAFQALARAIEQAWYQDGPIDRVLLEGDVVKLAPAQPTLPPNAGAPGAVPFDAPTLAEAIARGTFETPGS